MASIIDQRTVSALARQATTVPARPTTGSAYSMKAIAGF